MTPFNPEGRTSISASKIGNLLGLGYKSRYETLAELRGLDVSPATEGDFEIRAKNHGSAYEAEAADLFLQTHKEFTPIGSVGCQYTLNLRINQKFDISATPDLFMRSTSGMVLLEVKCPYRAWLENNSDPEFRLYYFAQIQFQLLITGLETAYLAIYVPPSTLQTYKIKRHTDYHRLLMQMCQASYFEDDPTTWRLRPGEKKMYTYLTRNAYLTSVEKLQ